MIQHFKANTVPSFMTSIDQPEISWQVKSKKKRCSAPEKSIHLYFPVRYTIKLCLYYSSFWILHK